MSAKPKKFGQRIAISLRSKDHGQLEQVAEANDPSASNARRNYWSKKLTRIAMRDVSDVTQLKAPTLDTVNLWKCELADTASVTSCLSEFLGSLRLSGKRSVR